MGMWDMAASAWTPQREGSGMFEYFKESFNVDTLAPDLLERVQVHTKKLASLDLFRRTSAAARKLRYTDETDCIRLLDDIKEMQHTNRLMQGFMVAMPEYRKLYNDNLAAGYESGFSKTDVFRGTGYKHTDPNYREATSGFITHHEDERVWMWASDADRQHRPDLIEKQMIAMSWKKMSEMDWEDGDPCSELNASC